MNRTPFSPEENEFQISYTVGVGRRGLEVHERQLVLQSLYQIRESMTKLRASREAGFG